MKSKIGIVLKVVSEQSYIIFLDRMHGKQKGVCFSRVSAGSYVIYTSVRQKNNSTLIKIQDIVHVPVITSYEDLVFLHQVLEVCRESIPFNCVSPSLFPLLAWACINIRVHMTDHVKNLFFAKLCMELGLHTVRRIICDMCIVAVHRSSVDSLASLSLDSKCTERVQQWVYYCLMEHLSSDTLKTLSFFKKRTG